MTNSQDTNSGRSGTDLWIVVGVVACLGLGASATYWLSSVPTEAPAQKKSLTLQGDPINSNPVNASQATAATAPAPKADDGYPTVTFNTLGSFYYEIPNLDKARKEKPKEQIPQPIKNLNGKKVAVQGFMVPVKLEKGATKSFLLVKDQSLCCFGRIPRMNEWVSVKMTGDKAAKFIGDQPVTVCGKIEVGEEIDQGEVLSIYRIEADDVAGPLDL